MSYIEETPLRFGEFQKFISKQINLGNVEELEGCPKCKGTGLSSIYSLEYCKSCSGSGIKKLELKKDSCLYICRVCKGYGFLNGFGCKSCKGIGFLDWVDVMVGV